MVRNPFIINPDGITKINKDDIKIVKENIYGYVPNVPGTTYGVTYIGRPIKTKQNSEYLEDVTDFIKLNYKCKAGTVDDSNKCGLEQNTTSLTDRYDDKNTSSNVIAGYVRNDNKLVNSILSGDYDLSEKDKNYGLEKIRLLDNIFKDKLLPEKEITYRGISKSNIKNLPDNWNKIGNVISPGTFLSTSRSRSEAEGFITGGSNDDSILIKLILPRNTNAINVSDFVPKTSAYAYSFDENEVLVDRNTEFKVVDYRIENSRNMGELHIATWEAIPDEQKQNTAYLSDVFETIKLNYNCPDSEKIGSGPGSCGGNTDSKINLNPEIAPADYNSFFENFNKISKDKSEPDRVMRRLNAETVQRRFYRKTEEHFNEIKPENDKKLKENGEKLWDNLRPEVQSAIKSYTTQDYGVINSALQDDIIREEVSLLKEATSKPLGVSTILYRGINFKMPKDIFKVGATWIHKPFASCSTGSFIAEEAARGKLTHITPEEKTILQIFTEPETKGFAVGKNSFHAGADAGSEVILDAGTKFQTIHSEKRGGMRILTVRAINDEQKQDSSYLEDVTNFIKLNYKCPKGTVDDSNKCNAEDESSESFSINNVAINKLLNIENPNIEHNIVFKGNNIIGHYTGENDSVDIPSDVKKDMSQNFGKYDVAHNHPSNLNTVLTPSGGDIKLAMERGGKNYVVTSKYIYKYSFDNKNTDINFPDKWRHWSKHPEQRNNLEKTSSDIDDKWTQISLNIKYLNKKFPENKNFETVEQRTEIAHKALKTFAKKIGMNYNRIPLKMKENSFYLADAFETIKLNYKCPKGTVDDSNKCNPEEQEKSSTSDSKSASETFIGFKADHDFSSPQDVEANKLIQASLDKAAEPLEKISEEELQSLRGYTSTTYKTINDYLSGGLNEAPDFIIEETKRNIDNLDKMFVNADLQEPLVTYRGLKDDIMVKNPELRDALDTPGSEIEFPCFSSTSALPFMANNFAEGYNGRLLELQLPTGTKALFIAGESGVPNEFEILVNRGTKFKVVETRYTNIIPPNNGSYKDRSAKHVKITTIKAIV